MCVTVCAMEEEIVWRYVPKKSLLSPHTALGSVLGMRSDDVIGTRLGMFWECGLVISWE